MDEYIKNPIASDSEDEKKIQKAQSRAERKIKEVKKRRKEQRESSRPYKKPAATESTPTQVTWKSGNCYRCNKKGHWRRECTEVLQENKISTVSELYHLIENSVSEDTCDINNDRSCMNDSPVGRLKENIGQWREIGANSYVMEVIKNGYILPLFTSPCEVELSNNRSAINNANFVSREVEVLLKKGCISEVQSKPKVVNSLTVAGSKSTKLRLVLDARHVNPHLFKFKHKFEDANTSRFLFTAGDYIFSFDLKSAYHHIEIHKLSREYLGFHWMGKYYVFNVLPFGISTAGYIFSKVMRQVVKFWRSKGIRIVMYLDDGFGGGSNLQEAELVSEVVQSDLKRLGFLIAVEKCHWQPTQEVVWLGLVWNTKLDKVKVSDKRIEKLKQNLENILNAHERGCVWFEVRGIASVAGQLISTQTVFGKQTRLRTRYLFFCISNRSSWNAYIRLSEEFEAIGELEFWCQNIEDMNSRGSSLGQLTDQSSAQISIFCDAPDSGYGCHLTDYFTDEQCLSLYGFWNVGEQKQSSTWRELEAVRRVLEQSVDKIRDMSVEVFCDNQNVEHILQVGSKKRKLQNIAMSVKNFCSSNGILLKCHWIPREENVVADRLSKLSDCDDWSVRQNVFDYFDKR